VLAIVLLPSALFAQRGQPGPPPAPPTPQAAAPIDLTGYWVSMIVDEWRFRVTPQKGDILYLPLNNNARQVANAWDPAKDEAEGKQCKAYGAVGVMQRPGRLHVTWMDPGTLKIESDAGTQTRLLHFGASSTAKSPPSWQGNSVADWQTPGGGRRGAPTPAVKTGNLRVVTSNMLPGYIRKNGVPYSDAAVLTEYFNVLAGQQNDVYMAVTAMVEDPTYLTQPFVRTYQFKKAADAAGWEPTPCWNR
jgi:hypothetical protein